jgi:hypothetical protein
VRVIGGFLDGEFIPISDWDDHRPHTGHILGEKPGTDPVTASVRWQSEERFPLPSWHVAQHLLAHHREIENQSLETSWIAHGTHWIRNITQTQLELFRRFVHKKTAGPLCVSVRGAREPNHTPFDPSPPHAKADITDTFDVWDQPGRNTTYFPSGAYSPATCFDPEGRVGPPPLIGRGQKAWFFNRPGPGSGLDCRGIGFYGLKALPDGDLTQCDDNLGLDRASSGHPLLGFSHVAEALILSFNGAGGPNQFSPPLQPHYEALGPRPERTTRHRPTGSLLRPVPHRNLLAGHHSPLTTHYGDFSSSICGQTIATLGQLVNCPVCASRKLVCSSCGLDWIATHTAHAETIGGSQWVIVNACPLNEKTRLRPGRRNRDQQESELRHQYPPIWTSQARPVPRNPESVTLSEWASTTGLLGTHFDHELQVYSQDRLAYVTLSPLPHKVHSFGYGRTHPGSYTGAYDLRLTAINGTKFPTILAPSPQLPFYGSRRQPFLVGNWSPQGFFKSESIPRALEGPADIVLVRRALLTWWEAYTNPAVWDDNFQSLHHASANVYATLPHGVLDWPICIWVTRVVDGARGRITPIPRV